MQVRLGAVPVLVAALQRHAPEPWFRQAFLGLIALGRG